MRLVGMQLNLYDVPDEGAGTVVENSALAHASVLLPAVTFYRETKSEQTAVGPSAGALPHNPVRDHHEADGGVYFKATPERYPAALVPPESRTPGVDGEAAMQSLRQATASRGTSIVPWVTLLHIHRVCEQAPESCMVNAEGETVRTWLCPSRPETLAFVEGLLLDVVEKFDPPAVFLDRFRFPEWGPGGLPDAMTCFCSSCERLARSSGVDIDGAREAMLRILRALEQDPEAFASAFWDLSSTPVLGMRRAVMAKSLIAWARFRTEIVERLVADAHRVLEAKNVATWLDLWSPSYAWIFGQDLARLAAYADWVKPFTYFRLGGGAHIATLIRGVTPDDDARQALYEAYLGAFGFSGPARLDDFAQQGLDPSFVTSESRLARRLLSGRAKLAAGLQLWGHGPADVRRGLEHAAEAQCDGVIFHCHGWATLEELAAAGVWFDANPRGLGGSLR